MTQAITRRTDRGVPRYADAAPGSDAFPINDDFLFNGEELVPELGHEGPDERAPWPRRADRVLMFHHFKDEPGVGESCLVRLDRTPAGFNERTRHGDWAPYATFGSTRWGCSSRRRTD
ncbi:MULTISPECIES: hypothetical protein [unclassified Streptomyces]|uniref:hypothetical protein n=1 Tax=unclassified Streptomyces TaxID=2593676 RepID=UPI00278C6EAB|nr:MULTISPECIES: hypothetical protein [unclassified Streptomyces]